MKRQRVHIVSNGTGAATKVLIDGKPMPNVKRVTWTVGANEAAIAQIEVVLVSVEVEGDLARQLSLPLGT